MAEPKLSKAYSRYGASMGRREARPQGDQADLALKVRLYRVSLDSGGYDNGGAYWGNGRGVPPLYRAVGEATDSDGSTVEVEHYWRAWNRNDAKCLVLCAYPNARFYR